MCSTLFLYLHHATPSFYSAVRWHNCEHLSPLQRGLSLLGSDLISGTRLFFYGPCLQGWLALPWYSLRCRLGTKRHYCPPFFYSCNLATSVQSISRQTFLSAVSCCIQNTNKWKNKSIISPFKSKFIGACLLRDALPENRSHFCRTTNVHSWSIWTIQWATISEGIRTTYHYRLQSSQTNQRHLCKVGLWVRQEVTEVLARNLLAASD